jgi:hypothetical protein
MMEVAIEVYTDYDASNPGKQDTMKLTNTRIDNYNYVSIEMGGQEFEVGVIDLYRALLPFIDIRDEGHQDE